MIRRRFTTEEAWEKIDDVQGVIVDLLGRYDGFSEKDIAHLEKAYAELNHAWYSLNDKLIKGKR